MPPQGLEPKWQTPFGQAPCSAILFLRSYTLLLLLLTTHYSLVTAHYLIWQGRCVPASHRTSAPCLIPPLLVVVGWRRVAERRRELGGMARRREAVSAG